MLKEALPERFDGSDLDGLFAGPGLFDLESDGIVPLQTEMAVLLYAGLVQKHISMLLGRYETIAFFFAVPFDMTFHHASPWLSGLRMDSGGHFDGSLGVGNFRQASK